MASPFNVTYQPLVDYLCQFFLYDINMHLTLRWKQLYAGSKPPYKPVAWRSGDQKIQNVF